MQYRRARIRPTSQRIALAALACLLPAAAIAQSDAAIANAARACQSVADASSRLACYDAALPPAAAAGADVEPTRGAAPVATAAGGESGSPRGAARASAQAPARRSEREPEPLPTTVRIVEIETPSIGTTLFHAADGRIFVRERARTIPRWPTPPFDVEVETSLFGTSIYLRFSQNGLRERVTVRD